MTPMPNAGSARPRCRYCDKPLRLWVTSMEWPRSSQPPTEYEGKRILKITRCKKSLYGMNNLTYMVWVGHYEGYGRAPDGVPYFCTQRCGVDFGRIAANAGYRRTK